MVSTRVKLPAAEKKKVKNVHNPSKLDKIKKKKVETHIKNSSVLKKKLPKSQIKEITEEKSIKKIKYVMPVKSVTESLVNSALNALEELNQQNKKTNAIFEDETTIFVEINCMKIQNCKGNIKFVFPHSTVASTGEVCLITPDIKKGRKVDHEPTVDRWEEILREAGVTTVKTVLPMRQLRVEYDQFELKRRLLTQHDFIMVDTRVLNHVSHLLGKMFFKKHNMLVPVRLDEKSNIKKDLDIGLRTAMLRLSEGATSTIIVGHTGMPQNKVKENILSLVQQLQKKYPGGEANIRSLALKFPLSLALPLYVTLRPSNTVDAPKMKQKKPKHFVEVEDELSTIPGSTVRVAPDGTVHVKKPQKLSEQQSEEEELDESDDQEEESDNDA